MRRFFRSILENYPSVIQFLRKGRDLLDQNAPVRMTKWGFTLAGNDAMALGAFEPGETALVRKLLLEVDVLVNVGANIGYYCCHALSLNRPVIAFEPIARNLHYLLRNIRNNGWSNSVEIFPVAVGSTSDILQIYGGGTGASLVKGWASTPDSYTTQVPVLSLDRALGDVINDRRALILVDIEGSEYMLLQGAAKTLTNNPKPIWIMEISTTEHQPKGVYMNPNFIKTFTLFFKHGYRAFTADLNEIEIHRHNIDEVINGLVHLNTNNFIFR